MATVIRFKADGITDEMIVPSIKFGLNSLVDVTNPTQEIDFRPISISEFSFAILSPKPETTQKLVEWISCHEIKKEAKFIINKQALTESAREILLKDVCLTSYNENIDQEASSISLTVVGRKVNIGDIEIDQSTNR
jgi:hypothetical protein